MTLDQLKSNIKALENELAAKRAELKIFMGDLKEIGIDIDNIDSELAAFEKKSIKIKSEADILASEIQGMLKI